MQKNLPPMNTDVPYLCSATSLISSNNISSSSCNLSSTLWLKPSYRRVPAQDVPFYLIIWYIAKKILLFWNRTTSWCRAHVYILTWISTLCVVSEIGLSTGLSYILTTAVRPKYWPKNYIFNYGAFGRPIHTFYIRYSESTWKTATERIFHILLRSFTILAASI